MLKVLTWASKPGPKGLCCSQTLSRHLGSSTGLELLLSVNTAASAGASAPQDLAIPQRASSSHTYRLLLLSLESFKP